MSQRNAAGVAAFEIALQNIVVRQDRCFHLVELIVLLFSLIFFFEAILGLWFLAVQTLLPPFPGDHLGRGLHSTLVTVVSLAVLLLARAAKKAFAIEPGEHTVERLNREVLEPCLGITFAKENGKLYTDGRSGCVKETYYSMRYNMDAAPAAN